MQIPPRVYSRGFLWYGVNVPSGYRMSFPRVSFKVGHHPSQV